VKPTNNAASERLIPLIEVKRRTFMGRSSIYAGIRAMTFPRPVKCGASSRWLESDIDAYILARVAERDAKHGHWSPKRLAEARCIQSGDFPTSSNAGPQP
jgi:prophage regulatory protein